MNHRLQGRQLPLDCRRIFSARNVLFFIAVVFIVLGFTRQRCQFYHQPASLNDVVRIAQNEPAAEGDTLQRSAPFLFPMGPNSKIILPEAVATIVIDVGARDSLYLQAMEGMREIDLTTALFMFDPLPESFTPLAARAFAFSQHNASHHDRVFAVRAAMGEKESVADFNLNWVGDCGSLLPTGNSSFPCAETSGTIQVQVFTLASFLSLLDERKNYTIHIKVDAEGADLHVLKGAGIRIRQASSVVIECQDLKPDDSERLLRIGTCRVDDAKEYMCQQHGFCDIAVEVQGSEFQQCNMFFTKGLENVHVAPTLYHGQFRYRYRSLEQTGSMAIKPS